MQMQLGLGHSLNEGRQRAHSRATSCSTTISRRVYA
jgi:hypothetical protein